VNSKSAIPLSFQSIVTFRNSQGDAARGTLLRVERGVVVLEVYNPYSIVQLSEVLSDFTIRRGEDPIYHGRAVVSNLVNTGLILIVSASLIDPWVQPATRFAGEKSLFRDEANGFIDKWSSINRLRDDYRITVLALRTYLSDLNQWLQRVESDNADEIKSVFSTFDGVSDYAQPLLDKLSDLNRSFEEVAQRVDPEDLTIHKAYTQRELHPLLMNSPYPYRTFNKPLGYAGDYEMMNMTHRDVPEGPTAYAKLVNMAYTDLPIARCVRNRVNKLGEYLTEGAARAEADGRPFRVVSIGCGPAVEVQRFIRGNPAAERSDIRLIDFNAETLAHAKTRIDEAMEASRRRVTVAYLQASVHFLLKRASSREATEDIGAYDLVYCAGLFDYLSDRVCARLTRLFYQWVRPGGTLLVTNMHERTLNRYIIEHMVDWFLIYRNEGHMLRFIPGLGVQRTYCDDTGINLCLEVRREVH
jgi:extracellular factor (EF) 3-hydroxypalmitic acid methyl ester biosynthesis protein